eukprot:357832-Chlamydomonas_euryale.AAC.9
MKSGVKALVGACIPANSVSMQGVTWLARKECQKDNVTHMRALAWSCSSLVVRRHSSLCADRFADSLFSDGAAPSTSTAAMSCEVHASMNMACLLGSVPWL